MPFGLYKPVKGIWLVPMENTPPLTTAGNILAAYQRLAVNKRLLKQARGNGLLTKLIELFMLKPTVERAGCADSIEQCDEWRPETIEFILPIVDAYVENKNFDAANGLLERARNCSSGSKEERKVVEKGLAIVDACVEGKNFDVASHILDTAYSYYEIGSKGERKVVEKGLAIVDACVEGRNFDAAVSLLYLAYGRYEDDSKAERKVVEKGLAIVDACVEGKDFDAAVRLLDMAYGHYPDGRGDHRSKVVEKGLAIVDACVEGKNFDAAVSLLERASNYYPRRSRERGAVKQRLATVKQRRLAEKLGRNVDVSLFKEAVTRELLRLRKEKGVSGPGKGLGRTEV